MGVQHLPGLTNLRPEFSFQCHHNVNDKHNMMKAAEVCSLELSSQAVRGREINQIHYNVNNMDPGVTINGKYFFIFCFVSNQGN